jgi:TPP-dependent trihydroxycyclohexane-1,2-dione (THcHDO) dehydratase
MKKLLELSWRNVIIILFLFYLVGDVYKQTLIGINKGITNFQQYRANKEHEEYLQSDEYKISEMDSEISSYKMDVEFSKESYEMKKGYSSIYSKKELDEEKQEYLSKQKTLNGLIEKRNEFVNKIK